MIIMLEFVSEIKGNPHKLGFVDEYSPKEWEPIINHRLSGYKEFAYVDAVNINRIIVILELNPVNRKLNSENIKKEIELFKEYYNSTIEDIRKYKLYNLHFILSILY